jgi:CHAT domain-containing protein
MAEKQSRLPQRFQSLAKKLSRWLSASSPMRSPIFLVLLFFLAMAVPLAAAPVYLSTPIPQTQPENTSQLVERARSLYQAGQFEEAVVAWQQAADTFAARRDSLNQAMALSNLSLTHRQLGKWDRAKRAITQSLKLLQTLPKSLEQQRIFAATLDIQGQLQLAIGQPESALQTWQEAADLYEAIGDRNGVMGSQINQAQALQNLGLYPRACQVLLDTLEFNSLRCEISETELKSLKTQQPLSLQILALRSLGNILRAIGQADQSRMILLKSWELAQKSENYPDMGSMYLSLGNTFRALGNERLSIPSKQLRTPRPPVTCISVTTSDRADEFYQQAADCYRQAESDVSPTIATQAMLNLLSLSIQTQQVAELPVLLAAIQAQIDHLPLSRTAVSTRLKFAQSLLCLQVGTDERSPLMSQEQSQLFSPILQSCPVKHTVKNSNDRGFSPLQIPSLTEIRQWVVVALHQAQILGDKKAEANALGYLAAVSQQMGNWEEAQQLTESALQRLSAFDAPELAYLWQWQLGRLYQLQEKPKEAIAAYTLAWEILQSLRRDLVTTNPDIQFTFRERVEPVYRELVDLLLQPSHDQAGITGDISQDNLKKARDIIESLQLAELDNFFQEACLESDRQQIDQVDPKAAIIYSIILPERLAVILSVPERPLHYYETILDSNQETGKIDGTLNDLFATLNPFISNPNLLVPYQEFYNWLIRPATAELANNDIQTLVFVLDGILRSIPVSALHDGQQFLIEKYNIALTPSLKLFNVRPFSLEKPSVLAGGLTESRQGFSALPGVEREIKEIAEAIPTEVLLNGNFTRTGLETKIQSNAYSVLHLATHGQFSSQAEDTFLLTWDERINVKNLDRLLREQGQFVRSPIELLILSACETAVGDKRAALGLAGVAVRSGARSTVATLWSVQDESTADFMTHFYQVLNQPKVTKANALRQAQLSLLHSPQYQHPFYWAPFVLVGNWL